MLFFISFEVRAFTYTINKIFIHILNGNLSFDKKQARS